jgi:anti-sigma B factor antagonist
VPAEELELKVCADGALGADVVVELAGELDLSSAGQLRSTLHGLYESGITSLVLDLSRLVFVDSTGLSEFVAALKHCRERGGDVVLRSPTASASRVLNISGLDQVFTIVPGSAAS